MQSSVLPEQLNGPTSTKDDRSGTKIQSILSQPGSYTSTVPQFRFTPFAAEKKTALNSSPTHENLVVLRQAILALRRT